MKIFDKVLRNQLSADKDKKGLELELIVTDVLTYNLYARFWPQMTPEEHSAVARALTCIRVVQTHGELRTEYDTIVKEEEARLKTAIMEQREVG